MGLDPKRTSLGVAAGDFDADGKIDLALTGVGFVRLLHNVGGKFEDITATSGLKTPSAVTLAARWLDLDQDGDLDLYVVNFCGTRTGQRYALNTAFRNDGLPAAAGQEATKGLSVVFHPWHPPGEDGQTAEALGGGEAVEHTGVAALDADGDGGLDLVLTRDGLPPRCVLNDRLERFHALPLDALGGRAPIRGLLATDFDQDGRADLVLIPEHGKLALWRNRGAKHGDKPPIAFEFYPADAHDWCLALAADLDLDGAGDLIGFPVGGTAPVWARNVGNGFSTTTLDLGPDSSRPLRGLALADLVGDALPDLVLLRDGDGPFLAHNFGNAHHWLALRLAGRETERPSPCRTNPHGLGAAVVLEGPGLRVVYQHNTTESGLAQSVGPVVLGLGAQRAADLVRLTWPDGVMQCEMGLEADRLHVLPECNRRPAPETFHVEP